MHWHGYERTGPGTVYHAGTVAAAKHMMFNMHSRASRLNRVRGRTGKECGEAEWTASCALWGLQEDEQVSFMKNAGNLPPTSWSAYIPFTPVHQSSSPLLTIPQACTPSSAASDGM